MNSVVNYPRLKLCPSGCQCDGGWAANTPAWINTSHLANLWPWIPHYLTYKCQKTYLQMVNTDIMARRRNQIFTWTKKKPNKTFILTAFLTSCSEATSDGDPGPDQVIWILKIMGERCASYCEVAVCGVLLKSLSWFITLEGFLSGK